MTRTGWAVVAGILAILAAIAATAFATGRDEGWTVDRFDSAIAVLSDGTLRVVESIDVDFASLERHGIFRDIPTRYRFDRERDRVYTLRVDSVTDAAGKPRPYRSSASGPGIRLQIGDPAVTVSGRQSYRISYRVLGALNSFADHDELFWNVNGGDWPVAARQVTASVGFDRDAIDRLACYEGATGSRDPCRADSFPRRATFAATRELPAHQQLSIVVAIRKGAVAVAQPAFEEHVRDLGDVFSLDLPIVVGSLALLAVGSGLAAWLVWRRGRDEQDRLSTGPVVVEYEPPDRLRPAEIGVLVDEVADAKDLTATIVDLAVRGYLSIEEAGAHDWRLRQKKHADASLAAFERVLFDALFTDRAEVAISELRGTFRGPLRESERALYADAMAKGWFAADPEKVRTRWGVLGCGVIVAGLAVAGIAGALLDLGLVGLALAAVGMVVLVLSGRMPRRSVAGSETLRRARGFQRYMETAETERARFAERESLFTQYLPYAIVFGSVTKWARAFAGLDVAQAASSWYTGTSGLDAMRLSSGLQSFSSGMSTAISITPTAAGGGGGFSGGFSGGFAGGAGGGGGGGGGGSW